MCHPLSCLEHFLSIILHLFHIPTGLMFNFNTRALFFPSHSFLPFQFCTALFSHPNMSNFLVSMSAPSSSNTLPPNTTTTLPQLLPPPCSHLRQFLLIHVHLFLPTNIFLSTNSLTFHKLTLLLPFIHSHCTHSRQIFFFYLQPIHFYQFYTFPSLSLVFRYFTKNLMSSFFHLSGKFYLK